MGDVITDATKVAVMFVEIKEETIEGRTPITTSMRVAGQFAKFVAKLATLP